MLLKTTSLHLSRKTLLTLLTLAWFSLLSACAPATAEEIQHPLPTDYVLYLGEDFLADEFVALDPQTLKARKGAPDTMPGFYSTRQGVTVEVQYDTGPEVRDEEQMWVTVSDMNTGKEQARFNPPAAGYISGFSADGSRLLWRTDLANAVYPPPIEWYVLNAQDGQVLAYIEDEQNACFRQHPIFSRDGRTIYCAVDPALESKDGQPAPLRIAAYDVAAGVRTADIEVPGVRIGGEPTTHYEVQVYEFLEPALLLSPDGSHLTVYDAARETITLINLPELSVDKSFSLNSAVSFFDLFSTAAHAKGLMDGVIGNGRYSLDGTKLYLFDQELLPFPEEEPPGELGLRLVDLEKESVAAEALSDYQIQWLYPAPDGSVFVFGTEAENMMPYEILPDVPSILWRLDGQTLQVLAQRPFDGFRAGRIVYTD